MNKNLLILGAGQYGMVAREAAEAMHFFEKIDFLDDHEAAAPAIADGRLLANGNSSIIGTLNQLDRFPLEYTYAVVAIGNPVIRADLLRRLQHRAYQIATLIHPKAYVSPSAELGRGCVIEPMAVVNAQASIGKGTFVCAGAVVSHNAIVGSICRLDAGCAVKPDSIVPMGYRVEAGEIYSDSSHGDGLLVADYMSVQPDDNADWAIKFKKNFGTLPSVY